MLFNREQTGSSFVVRDPGAEVGIALGGGDLGAKHNFTATRSQFLPCNMHAMSNYCSYTFLDFSTFVRFNHPSPPLFTPLV